LLTPTNINEKLYDAVEGSKSVAYLNHGRIPENSISPAYVIYDFIKAYLNILGNCNNLVLFVGVVQFFFVI
jgi:hypothetical protein